MNEFSFFQFCTISVTLCLVFCSSWYVLYVRRRRAVSKAKTDEDEAKLAGEARMKASLAAQQRQEAFDKSEAGQAARVEAARGVTTKVAAEPHSSSPPSQRGAASLRTWHVMMG